MIGIIYKYENTEKIIVLNKKILIGVFDYNLYDTSSLEKVLLITDIKGECDLGFIEGSDEEIYYKMIIKKFLSK
ncbi:MAG: hypothetical protein ACI35W_00595 [Anaeroplasmataceae bacterium]